MSYHIYTTKGIILSAYPWREADRIYAILTRDLGLIHATALGVRKEVSKLRGNLEPFSLAVVSLVRSKERWRLTSAELTRAIPGLRQIAQPLFLIEQLVQGEAPHPELFDLVERCICLKDYEYDSFEHHLVSQALFHLGYLKESDLELRGPRLIGVINEGIRASQML